MLLVVRMSNLLTIVEFAQTKGIGLFDILHAVHAGMPKTVVQETVYIDEETAIEPYLKRAQENKQKRKAEKALQQELEREVGQIKLPQGYKIEAKLGKGGSRNVYLVSHEASDFPRKMKIYRPDDLSKQIQEQRKRRTVADIARNECDFLAFGITDEEVRKYVTQYFEHGRCTYGGKETFYIVQGYVLGGNVEEALPTLTFGEKCLVFRAIKTA